MENITQLKDIITVELFYLNAKSAVYSVSAFSYFYSILKQCKNDPAIFITACDDSLSLDPQLSRQ